MTLRHSDLLARTLPQLHERRREAKELLAGGSEACATLVPNEERPPELLLEEVSEHHYRIDRTMFHVTASPNVRRVARLRLGRVGHIPANDPDFGRDELAVLAVERLRVPGVGAF